LAVAGDPFRYTDVERLAFDECRLMLCNLQVYHLPSEDPGYVMEIHTDASGGAGTKQDPGQWGAVLGQRRDVTSPIHAEGFELLQLAGGSFNERQAKWDILRKECAALYMAVKGFRLYTFGRCIRIIVDSKVLTYMHRSAVPMVQRWYSFIQSQDYVMIHFSSEKNSFADALTRCTYIPPAARLVGIEPNPGPMEHIILSSDTSDDDLPIISAITRSAAVSRPPSALPALPSRRQRTRQPTRGTPAPLTLSSPADTSAPPLVQQPLASPVVSSPPLLEQAPVRQSPLHTFRIVVPPAPDDAPPLMAPSNPAHPSLSQPPPEAIELPVPFLRLIQQSDTHPTTVPWTIMLPNPVVEEPEPPNLTTVHVVGHSEPASPSSLFHALAFAITHHDANAASRGHHFNNPCASHHVDDCRESVVAWMTNNSLLPCSHLRMSPFEYRRALYSNDMFGLYHNGAIYHPQDWLSYLSLLNDPATEPDELILLCAAACFSSEIVVILRDDRTCVITPTLAFRRIYLTFHDGSRHFNWCHIASQQCNDPDNCNLSLFLKCSFATPGIQDEVIARPHGLSDEPDVTALRRRQIAAAHCGHTGHPGIHATLALLRSRRQVWRGMTAQVTQFIGRCATCILARARLNPAQPAIATLRLSSRPLRRWHCDQTGTLTPCKYTGYQRIITFICESTGYAVLYGSRFGSALEMAISLVHLVGTYGHFDSFHSDNGCENDNFIIQQFCKITGIKHTNSVPNNPETNGIVERGIQTVKRFLRTIIADGLASHNSWGFMIPIVQKAVNSAPFGPLQVPPSSIIFAALYCPEHFVIPSFEERRSQFECESDLADGNHYHPSANFVHRAAYFQQTVNNVRQEIMTRALELCVASPSVPPTAVAVGSQVLIPWPSDRPPTTLHPYRRGPYIVLRTVGNVLYLQHAVFPTPDSQAPSLRWSSSSQIFVISNALERLVADPSAAQAVSSIPFQRAIDCVLSHSVDPTFDIIHDTTNQRYHVQHQLYRCRLIGSVPFAADLDTFVCTLPYSDIQHTLAMDAYVLCFPFLHGHLPISNMPITWNPCLGPRSQRPMHIPDIAAERALPLYDPLVSDEEL
jgi:hypothetical protein